MADNRLEQLKKLSDQQQRYQKLLEMQEKSGKDYSASLETQSKKIKELANTLKSINSSNSKFLGEQEVGISSIGSSMQSLKDAQNSVLSTTSSLGTLNEAQRESISSILSDTRDLASLNAEDTNQILEKNESLEQQLQVASSLFGVNSQIVDELRAQYETGNQLAKLTEDEQKQLEKQLEAYKGIKDAIGGVLDTASALLKTTGGIVGGLVIGMGYVTEALGKTTREMGGFLGGLTGATSQVTLLGTIFPQALDSAKGLSSEFGGLSDTSFQTQLNTNLMATNMGISGQEAAALTGNFARLNGGSAEMGQNLAASTKELAKANGLMPSQIMADVAGSAKAFAEYGKQGGQNIGEAAVAAGKLGVNMSTLTGVTDHLLDFQSSITQELELGAMLGRNVNLNKARELAYQGKIGASVKEALNQMGGIDAFNKMDIFQKRKAAAALGLSTEELQKMSSNMDRLNDDGTMQLSTFESMSESLTAFATGPLGSTLKGLGSGIIAAGQMNMGLKSFGTSIWGMVKGLAMGLKSLVMYPIHLAKAAAIKVGGMLGIGGGAAASVATKATDSIADTAKDSIADKAQDSLSSAPDVDKSTGDKLKSLAGGLKEMGNAKVLFGALNLIPTGLGFLAILPGLPGMFGVGALGTKAGTGLMNLGIGLGFMGNGTVTAGAGNLALAGLAFTLMTAGILGLGAIALLGGVAAAGLTALAGGLVALGNPAVAGFAAIGVAILGGLSLAMMGVGYALGLAAPFVEAVGSVITSVFQGIATVIPVATASIISLMDSITLEKISGIALLSLAFMGLAASLYLVGSAGLFALPALLGIAAASVGIAVVAELFGLGSSSDESSESTALEEGSLSEYQSQMLENMKTLIAATSAPKDFIIDGQKFGRYITKNQKRDTTNNYALK